MTDSLKFGPEWLRNLSDTTPIQKPRFQRAEFRYGKEEMLALFSYTLPPPDSLKQLHGLFVEKVQPPLTLTEMTEDENRLWNFNVNSDALLRKIGKLDRSSVRGGGNTGGVGQTGRGRGRGGGVGNPFYRGTANNYDGSEQPPFTRSQRPYERTQSERGWSERNGGEGRGGGRSTESNWRRTRGGSGDDDEWRGGGGGGGSSTSNAKWPSSIPGRTTSGNWREEDAWDLPPHSNKNSHHLPEWATEKNSEGGGTFDSSGAFQCNEPFSEEDDVKPHRNEPKWMSSDNQKSKQSRVKNEPGGNKGDSGDGPGSKAEKHKEEAQPENSPKSSELPEPVPAEQDKVAETQPPPGNKKSKKNKSGLNNSAIDSKTDDRPPEISVPASSKEVCPSEQPPMAQSSSPKSSSPILQRPPPKIHSQPTPQPTSPSIQSHSTQPQQQRHPPSLNQPSIPNIQNTHSLPPHMLSPHHTPAVRQPQPDHLPEDALLSHMTDDLAADLVAKLMEDEEKQDKQWFYRDPQGQEQGPFSCSEMGEWFQSGYFTLNLLVRRACDPSYAPLGELIKLWGCIPFLAENHPVNVEVSMLSNQQQPVDKFMVNHYPSIRMLRAHQQSQPQPPPMHTSPLGKLGHEWMDHHRPVEPVIPQYLQHQQTANNSSAHLRALLAQMQQQQAKTENSVPPTPVMETLMSLHQQQMAAQQAPSPLQTLLRQMQANQINKMQHQQQQQQQQQHPNNIESVWNGGNWSQWAHMNTKGIKTEQQVLEEQLRAENERKEELRKQEEKRMVEEAEEKALREQQEVAKREFEEISRRRKEEEDIRKKQEASRRLEVERQRKEEEKRKKEEEKRKKEEEKRKRDDEERERLRDEERKKKEAEEAKKRQDVMAKVQRSQWCPPAASNTTILEIQRSEREQQLSRTMQQMQELQKQQQQQQQQQQSAGMQLKWMETPKPVESLADIQAEQQRQFLKQLEKGKQEKEKKKKSTAGPNQPLSGGHLGSWAKNLIWEDLANPAWPNSSSMSNNATPGFWDQPLTNTAQMSNKGVKPNQPLQQQQHQQHQQLQSGASKPKEGKSKAKRDEMAVLKLFSNTHNDEFTQWCTSTLSSMQMQGHVDIPTFVNFLRDIEAPLDVQEYIRIYFGDSREVQDFAVQFLERRSKPTSDPSSLSNQHLIHSQPSTNQDFQQVKSKGKKVKKGKMQKVDAKILGFSTIASSDRINVGFREYPDE